MNTLVLLAALSCPKTQIINKSGLPFNDADRQVLKTAQKRCGALYKASPCVKKFYKNAADAYWVVCGKPEGGQTPYDY